MLAPWPTAEVEKIDKAAEADMQWLQSLLLGIRQIRGEINLSPGKPLPLLLAQASKQDLRRLQDFKPLLIKLGKLNSVQVLADNDSEPPSATALVGNLRVLVPMAGVIDKTAELARLDKELAKLDSERARLASKLENPNFAAKAPPAVIEKERSKLQEISQAQAQLAAQRERIASL